MNFLKVVIDTNEIVSGLLFGGALSRILTLGFGFLFEWYSSPPLLKELEQVLTYRKFGLAAWEIGPIFQKVAGSVRLVIPKTRLDVIKRTPGDNRVLECAVESSSDFIVTGDRRDLLSLRVYDRIPIKPARVFNDC